MLKKFSKFLKNLTSYPGVYQMIDHNGEVIYIGKAKNLKNRVSSYFSGQKDKKTEQMISLINNIEITVTNSEQEAYILENSLIKQLKPKYNVIFRDDKSYPFIKISDEKEEEFPSLKFFRFNQDNKNKTIKQDNKDNLYGPFPSISSVRETIDLLQKTFKLRNCKYTTFKSRTRPCLQYQIKRCSAPCVGNISQNDYKDDVENAKLFLKGSSDSLINNLITKMNEVSKLKEYEKAAKIRDQIAILKQIQRRQIIITQDEELNLDVIAYYSKYNLHCFHLLSIRNGKIIGSKQFFVQKDEFIEKDDNEIFTTFIIQHYLNALSFGGVIDEIVISQDLKGKKIIEKTLSEELKMKIKIQHNVKSIKLKWLTMAINSAQKALKSELANRVDYSLWFCNLMDLLNYNFSNIACVDISHTQGKETIGAIVDFNENGPNKSNYRRFNVLSTSIGDDYQAIDEVLDRYISKKIKYKEKIPSLLLIDGGKGQYSIAKQVLDRYSIVDVKILSIAKGPLRKSGLENVFTSAKGDTLDFKNNHLAFLLLQHIRDEAHRFAIEGHRRKSLQRFKYSTLEDIPGIGSKRRKLLLCNFGGMQEIMQASIEELALVPGVSKNLAIKIFHALHG